MKMFISCDWGTSTFRLRLVDPTHETILAEVKSNQGIADAHTKWKQQALDEVKRFSFYQAIIADQLVRLQEQVAFPLRDVPMIVSGMASSNIGMVEIPYKELPFSVDGSDLAFKRMSATENFRHETIIISGAKTAKDVMRGEETQLIGCDFSSDKEGIYIFPGTHSKHVTVQYQLGIDFKTYMTGEFFHLLSHDSILSTSVQENNYTFTGDMVKSFEDGVVQSTQDNLLRNSFLVRTNHLLGDFSKEENYYYLSGLLIGTELGKVASGTIPLTIVANEAIQKFYVKALQILGNRSIDTVDADVALVKGHCKIFHLLQDRSHHPNIS